jgi:hypothetical protein
VPKHVGVFVICVWNWSCKLMSTDAPLSVSISLPLSRNSSDSSLKEQNAAPQARAMALR